MSISIPSQAISSSDPERVQPSQESLCPAPMEMSVQKTGKRGRSDSLESLVEKTAKRHLSDSFGLASEDCILPTLVYWLLNDNYTFNSLALTCKKNFQNVPAIVRTVLKGRQDVDYQATEMWRKRHILANKELLQKELAPLLASFGLPLFCTEENKKQTLDRITTILNALKESHLFTGMEKRHFATLSAGEIFEKPTLLYLLLQTADRHNLVRLFEYMCFLDNKKTFPQKLIAVLKPLQIWGEAAPTIWSSLIGVTNIPNEVYNMTQLRRLYVHNTPVTKLPESIGDLTQLKWLDVCNTQITELPEWIGNLTQLEWLNLTGTPITELPEWIGEMSNLAQLFLSKTQITELPEWIGNLTQLRGLELDNTQITELPESIGNLTQLVTLSLSNTQIKELPESIGNLAQLKYLHLRNTHITELPEALSRLPKLGIIFLSPNNTVQIPSSLVDRIDTY